MSKKEIMKISVKAYGLKHSIELSDASTWSEALDAFIKMLNGVGYSVRDSKKLQVWLDNTEVLDD